jgi:hypothetical protein
MEKKDLLIFELDLMKGRKGVPVGTEKQWGGRTFVKTPAGWRPKGEQREKKQEPVANSTSKEKDPSLDRTKQLEEFAEKASDKQLEAAIDDPKQNPEVKDIAQVELDKRTGRKDEEEEDVKEKIGKIEEELQSLKDSLSKDLDEKKKEPLKEIKKTGLLLDGHKVFIVMNENKTGYKTQGMKALKLESKEGESLSDFKKRIKETWKDQTENKESVSDKETTTSIDNDLEEKINKTIESLPEKQKNYYQNKYKEFKEIWDNIEDGLFGDYERRAHVGRINIKEIDLGILAMNNLLIEKGELPYCSPFLFQEWKGEQYKCFKDPSEALINYEKYNEELFKPDKSTRAILDYYKGSSFGLFTSAALGNKIDFEEELKYFKGQYDNGDFNDGIEYNQIAKEILESKNPEATMIKLQQQVDDFIQNSPPVPENLILSRRVEGDEMFRTIENLKVGDTFEMKPMQSFASFPQNFGSIQITLLVKKGEKNIVPIGNRSELEWVTKSHTKVKVISKGYSSMTVELVPDEASTKSSSNQNTGEGIKRIKKTGIMVNNHKMFITMNDKETGYQSKGYGISLESKEGESLNEFKERLKELLFEKLKAS